MFFDKLPAPWNGLGVEANYTYIDSENPGDLYFDIDGDRAYDAPVQGLSKNNYNVTAHVRAGAVVGAAGLVLEKQVSAVDQQQRHERQLQLLLRAGRLDATADIALPIYGDEYGQLDFGTTWRPTDKLALSAGAAEHARTRSRAR